MKSLYRLKPYLRPHLGRLIASAILAIPLAAINLTPVALIKFLLDDLANTHDRRRLALIPIAVIGIYVLNFVLRFAHYYWLRYVIGRVNLKIKTDLYEHLLSLSADHFTSKSTGTLISRAGSDPQILDQGIASLIVAVREPLKFFALLASVLYLNWKLTIISFAVFPPLAYVFSATGRNLKRYISRMQEENARLYSTLQESFQGIRVVKTFQLESYLQKKYEAQSENFNRYYMKTAKLEEAAHPMVELLMGIAIAGMTYYGGREMLLGHMSLGDLGAFFTAIGLMLDPIRRLNDINIKFNQSSAAAERIFEILDWRPSLHQSANPKPIRAIERSIALKDVRFAYPDAPERDILRGVSFEVAKGRIIALVGASGAGKSSLVNLLPRIFDVTGGRIEIDGQDIRELDLSDLRKLIAVVTQDVFLFNDTIEENIRCGRLDASQAEIRDAARRAHATDFIAASPNGFDTVIGDRGMKLSGGERQRISIARAFLRGSPVLILDEATSSLDSTSERAVQEALDELMVDRTTIVIAHRLSTIRHADQILVLKEGVVVERGTHEELLGRGGEYAAFHLVGPA